MAANSWFDSLSIEEQASVEAIYADARFSNYENVRFRVEQYLSEQGYELTLSKSTVARTGKILEERKTAIRAMSSEAAEIARLVKDDEGSIGDALTTMVQAHLYKSAGQEELDLYSLVELSKAVSRINQVQVAQKKWLAEYREKIAKGLDKAAKEVGISDETVAQIKRKILGIK